MIENKSILSLELVTILNELKDLNQEEIVEIDKKRMKWEMSEKMEYIINKVIGTASVLDHLQYFNAYPKIIDFLIKYDFKGELIYLLYNDVAKRDWYILGEELINEVISFKINPAKHDKYHMIETSNQLILLRERKKLFSKIIAGIQHTVIIKHNK